MAGKSKYDDDFKQTVVKKYMAGDSAKKLSKTFGVNPQTVYLWLEAAGVKPRNNYAKKNEKKVCRKCGHDEHSSKAQFCCMCGIRLKTDAELLIDDIQYIADMTQFFPASTRDKVIATVNKAISYIQEAEKGVAKDD